MRRELVALAAVILILAGAAWGWRVLFVAPLPEAVSIVEVQGSVRHVTPTGTVAAEVGQSVGTRDRLLAGPDGRATLALGGDARLTLDPSSAIEVVALDETGVRVELDGGRVSATVRPGGRTLAVAADGREVTASDADFTVARAEDGTLAVAAGRGEVATNLPGVATIGAGQKVVAPKDRQALVSPASEALLLSVAWPTGPRTRSAQVTVRGRTEPGARVVFDAAGGPVSAVSDADGAFVVSLDLEEGQNQIRAHATSPLGQEAEVTWEVVRDTEAPAIQVELRP